MSYNDPCSGCDNSKRDCTCRYTSSKPVLTLESEKMKSYRNNSDFMDFIELITEWDTEDIHESYPDGISQMLEESSANPRRQALLLIEYLYKSDKLREIISDFRKIK